MVGVKVEEHAVAGLVASCDLAKVESDARRGGAAEADYTTS